MTTRYQQTLAFLHSPAVTIYTEEERREKYDDAHRYWTDKGREEDPFTTRTPEDTAAILDKLARRPADWCQTDINPHAHDAFRADLLVKAMSRPGYWSKAEAAKRAALPLSPEIERVK